MTAKTIYIILCCCVEWLKSFFGTLCGHKFIILLLVVRVLFLKANNLLKNQLL